MKRETSLYLDLGRVLAALAVFAHNAKKEVFNGGFLAPFGQFGNEAVIVFFVISGIVIAHTAESREGDFTRYAVARLARLWSVVVPAIVVTVMLDCLGSSIAPSVYNAFALPLWRADLSSVWHAAAPILFLNQSWLGSVGPGSNGPFWSIGYEAPYYCAFGLFVFCRGWRRVVGLALTAAVFGPSVIGLAAFWLLGAGVFRMLGRGRPTAIAWAGWTSSLFLTVALYGVKYKAIAAASKVISGTPQASAAFEYLFPCACVAVLFAINVVCFDRIAGSFTNVSELVGAAIRFLAARTFSLYLYQAPLLFFFAACAAHVESRAARIAIVYLGAVGMVFALAEVTEKRKSTVAAWLLRALGQNRQRSREGELVFCRGIRRVGGRFSRPATIIRGWGR